jgi:tetratricopeptide (TPR) repeat protein
MAAALAINKKRQESKTSLHQKVGLMALGLFLALMIIEIALRLSGFVLASLQENRNLYSLSHKNAYHIMCIGESTTSNQYPRFLEKELNQRNLGIKFSVIDKGINGIKTVEILRKIQSYLDEYCPSAVIAMMGINDWGPHIPYEGVSGSRAINALKSFRTYKLTRLIWFRILKKSTELGFYRPKEGQSKIGIEPNFLEDELKEVYAKEINFARDEKTLKEIIEADPKNYDAYKELGWFCIKQGSLSRAEEAFKKAVKLDSKNCEAYRGLSWVYGEQDNFLRAEEILKKAIELNPESCGAYKALSWIYCVQSKLPQAEETLSKAVELDPKDYEAYKGLAWVYGEQDKFPQAEETFRKAIALDSKDFDLYNKLGWIYGEQGKYSQAEETFKKAIELDPTDYDPYKGLARVYRWQHKFPQAEETLKRAIKVDPKNFHAYGALGWVYGEQGKISQAEEVFEKSIEIDPKNDWAYGALSVLHGETGNHELAKEYDKKATELRLRYYTSETVNSYRRLKEVLDKRGIKLICVQYPMRSVESLKMVFDGEEGVIFVDNEKIFKDAVRKTSYKEYFKDMFGGDFGHCSDEGNELLAKNIADAIVNSLLDK